MVRENADHLTRCERAELLRNHSANAKRLLKDAVRAIRRRQSLAGGLAARLARLGRCAAKH
jgi:hypothetical protein